MEIAITPEKDIELEQNLEVLHNLGVSAKLLERIRQATTGRAGIETLPQPISLRNDSSIDLAHADQEGCISFNSDRISTGLGSRFGSKKSEREVAVNKIFEEELLHAVHQSCPGYSKSAKLFGDAALEGDMKPLHSAATALSLYKRCMGGAGKIPSGDLLVNPELLEQGYGELLRMCAQYRMTGITTEMVVKPWTLQQQKDLRKIADHTISNWCKEVASGTWGIRCRNQFDLLCKVIDY